MRKSRSVIVAVLGAGALFVGVAGVQSADAATAESFEAAYAQAEAARKRAAEVGFEWRDTKKLLWYAKQYAEKGDYDKAQELAVKAKRQGELGVEQAKIQEKAWKDAVLR